MMLLNPKKMVLVYKGIKFDTFEFERGYESGMTSRVGFFAPVCGGCIVTYGLLGEERQVIENDEDMVVECGVCGCTKSATFFIEFDFGFEESDVEEKYKEDEDPMESMYLAELNFD